MIWFVLVNLVIVGIYIWAAGPRQAIANLTKWAAAVSTLLLVVVLGWTWFLKPAIDEQVDHVKTTIGNAVPKVPSIRLPWENP